MADGFDGRPFPEHAAWLVLPGGRVLNDAIIWRDFVQTELRLDPERIFAELLAYPTWPSDQPIPFRERGDDPHWIRGEHAALNYRGHDLRRHKMWIQSGYSSGFRRYGYSGWQNRISAATHALEHVPSLQNLVARLNAGLLRSAHIAHNHWIVTAYENADDNIGYHSDQDRDFAPDSWFVVIKLGAPRPFAFRMKPTPENRNPRPFHVQVLLPGTAVFVRCKAEGAANDVVEHGVPPIRDAVGVSGSIVSRCIETVIPWAEVRRRMEGRAERASDGEERRLSDAREAPPRLRRVTPEREVASAPRESATNGSASPVDPRRQDPIRCREDLRRLYHWFLDRADDVARGDDAELRRRARALLMPELHALGGAETGNFFDWVKANRTRYGTVGTVTTPPEGYRALVDRLRALLR